MEELRPVLRQTRGGEEKHLAFVDKVGVAHIWIRLGDARPRRAMAKLHFCDGPERVALADGVLRGSAWRSDRSWNDNLRAYWKNVGIAKIGIQGQQFLPAASVAEPRGCKLPECVARLHGDDREFS